MGGCSRAQSPVIAINKVWLTGDQHRGGGPIKTGVILFNKWLRCVAVTLEVQPVEAEAIAIDDGRKSFMIFI